MYISAHSTQEDHYCDIYVQFIEEIQSNELLLHRLRLPMLTLRLRLMIGQNLLKTKPQDRTRTIYDRDH